MLPMQGARVPNLVGELRSRMPAAQPKNVKWNNKIKWQLVVIVVPIKRDQ